MTGRAIEAEELVVGYGGRPQPVVLQGVSLWVGEGETVGLVGESGSGKSTLARVILGLLPPQSGSLRFLGEDVTHASKKRRRELGASLQAVFQNPFGSLNPALLVGQSVAEPLLNSSRFPTAKSRRERVAVVLEAVGLDPAVASRYPNQFSGGQRQRIVIARALVAEPRALVCDEPVSALDLSVQAQILNLLMELKASLGLSLLFISHDMAVVKFVSSRVYVMERGRIVESGDVEQVTESPQAPYTRRLIAAVPIPDPRLQAEKRARWEINEGAHGVC
jgi:ABC-type glutathione transport system ATPase component